MDFFRGLFNKKEPPSKEEELNDKEFSKFRSSVPCQKVCMLCVLGNFVLI
jgi:hypothetical protein